MARGHPWPAAPQVPCDSIPYLANLHNLEKSAALQAEPRTEPQVESQMERASGGATDEPLQVAPFKWPSSSGPLQTAHLKRPTSSGPPQAAHLKWDPFKRGPLQAEPFSSEGPGGVATWRLKLRKGVPARALCCYRGAQMREKSSGATSERRLVSQSYALLLVDGPWLKYCARWERQTCHTRAQTPQNCSHATSVMLHGATNPTNKPACDISPSAGCYRRPRFTQISSYATLPFGHSHSPACGSVASPFRSPCRQLGTCGIPAMAPPQGPYNLGCLGTFAVRE